MFGFGLKLKSKPKPTISAARRPRDQVVETLQKNDTIGHTKPTSNENNSQNSNAEKSEFDRSVRSTSTVVSDSVESVAHPAPDHLETGNINTDSKKDEEAPVRLDASSSSSVISLGNSSISNIDNDRNKTVPFIPKLLPKKNKFIPNVRAVRKTDDQSDKSTSNSPQKTTGSTNNEAVAAISEPGVDSGDIISKTTETSEMSRTAIRDEVRNQSTTSEQPLLKEPPVPQTPQSLHEINSPKEPLSSSKPISELSADKENTVCNDDSQIHNPGSTLQNSKKKKPRAQGTFLQMTIEAKKELNEKLKDGKLDKSKLIMRDLILYNPTSNPMPIKSRSKGIKEEKKCKLEESKSLEDEILSEQSVDDVEATRDSDAGGSMPVPQLKVGPDGKIILDSSSLVIETTGTEKSRTDLQNSELVEENEFTGFKYRKRRARRNDWSAEETVLFYKALNDLGADFSLMQSLFPSRTRRDLKLKFKKEERCNLSLVDKAMTHVGKFDFEALKEELTRDRAERSKRQEEQARLKEEAKKQLKLQKLEAKIKERQLKAEISRKLKDKQSKAKLNKRNSRKGVKRNRKLSTNEVRQLYKRPKNEISSDTENDREPLYNFDKPRARCDDDNEKIRYDTIFKTTKSGRSPRVRNTYLEECEKNYIKEALKTRKAADILREQLDLVSQMDMVVEEQPQLESVNSENSREMKICLFEDLSNLGRAEELEESSTLSNEEHYYESNCRTSIFEHLSTQNLPKTIKIVEELTSGISQGTVDVNGVMCKIISLNDVNELGGSSTFKIRDSQESNSNCCLRLESVREGAEADCQQLNYVISYDESNGESIELSSRMVVGGETDPNPSHSDHSYCIAESLDVGDDYDDNDDGNGSPIECRSFVVLKPNECVEIYNDS